jgi:hypothetical protein
MKRVENFVEEDREFGVLDEEVIPMVESGKILVEDAIVDLDCEDEADDYIRDHGGVKFSRPVYLGDWEPFSYS